MLGVGVSGVIFLLIRTQTRPAPKTMTAQYQAMTNEYLKVSQAMDASSGTKEAWCLADVPFFASRRKGQNPSRAYHPRVTLAKA